MMSVAQRIDFSAFCEAAAVKLWGEPSHKTDRELRWGNHGSRSLDRCSGVWFDHEANEGGSTVELLARELGIGFGECAAWLRGEGLLTESAFSKVSTAYSYTDEGGGLLFQVVRFEPKDFRQRRPDGGGGWIWSLGETRRVLYRLPEVIAAVTAGQTVYVVEGEKDCENLRAIGLVATCNPGGVGKWREQYNGSLRGGDIVIIGDNDDAGRKHAEQVAAALAGVAARVRVLDLAQHWPRCPVKGDVSDWLAAGGTVDTLAIMVAALPDWQPLAGEASAGTGKDDWPEPKPLPSGLLPVEPYRSEFMPAALAPWVDDISECLQCPPDYVAIATVVAFGSVIGRRLGIKPQAKTDWVEVPNLWGCFIGRPGMLKSPAMMAALKPIHRLEKEAAKNNEVAREAFAANMEYYKLQKQVKAALARDRLKEKMQEAKDAAADFGGLDLGKEPKEPVDLRYRTNDTSYEKLGELLVGNPAGILIERDELVSLLIHLDQEQQAVARGFYLSGWSGTQPYTFDRIGRGTVHLDAICLSVLGNTQPARIAEYVRRANAGGAGGDGLIQRFGLLVWPDQKYEWSDIDRYPENKAREAAWEAFERASKLDLSAALALGAHKGQYDHAPFLRFTEEARHEFLSWREPMERMLRTGGLSPALEGHLAKFRKLVPALALINHIADSGDGDVTQAATARALAFAGYLESHARRVYASALEAETAAAKAILKHIRSGDLQRGFTARDIHQRDWAHLTERDHVGLGLRLLEDHDFIRAEQPEKGPRGGRPKVTYSINPKVKP
jgi:Protein of unknown function (DUF3987)